MLMRKAARAALAAGLAIAALAGLGGGCGGGPLAVTARPAPPARTGPPCGCAGTFERLHRPATSAPSE
ncbi:MAG TPA: hypothetical protein VM695_02730 [Phycisphaerae bacterium]|nr:hypothetical protein [Phycisphaerae bacterium]